MKDRKQMQKRSKNVHIQDFERIMPLCLALFFTRTVFIGYKYLFFLLLVPCVVYSVYVFLNHSRAIPNIKKLWLPASALVLFFVHFTPISNVIKESINILLLLYFIVFSKLYYANYKFDVFLKWIVRFTLFAGCLAIFRFLLSLFEISLPFYNIFFEGDRFTLVNDNNFYSLFFIISIILSGKLFLNSQITKAEHLIVNIVAVINIVAGLSRRAYVLYALSLVFITLFVILKKQNLKRTLFCNVLIVIVISVVCGGLLFSSSVYYSPDMAIDKKYRCYKIYSLFNNSTYYSEFDIKQSRRYYEQHQFENEGDNLFYNGDLRYGLNGWSALASPHDCLRFNIVMTESGDSAIRVTRGCSSGCWQVYYVGRPMIYHKDITYHLSFSYRVIEGTGIPFRVGWLVNEGAGWCYNLPQTIEPIDSVWSRCTVVYKFQEDRMNPRTFLNSLRAGSSIEVKDILLTCDDTIGLPRYVDQLPDSVIHKYYSRDTINYLTASRTDRWRYALELWQKRYDTKQKIFGQGFKYLEWYGEKFHNNPDRHDFPHNPIISSFLYSGIIGGIVYIIFLIMSLWLYWKRRKELGIFFIMYLCCMFFSMFSGSSHFSFPLFAYLSFLPFVEFKNGGETKENISQ